MFPQNKKSSFTATTLSFFAITLFLSITSNVQGQNHHFNTPKKSYNTSKMLSQLQSIPPLSITMNTKEIPAPLPDTFVSKNLSKKITIQPKKVSPSQQTTIEFSIPNTSKVWLSLYSRGQKITTLLQGENIEGGVLQEVQLENIELNEDTYLFQLETEDETVWSDWWHVNN